MSKTIIRQIIELEEKSMPELRQLYNEIMPKPATPTANKGTVANPTPEIHLNFSDFSEVFSCY